MADETTQTPRFPRLRRLGRWLVRQALPFLLLAAALGGVAAVAKFLEPRVEDATGEPPAPKEVAVETVEPRTIVHTITLDGEVEANQVVQLSAQVPGEVQCVGPRDTDPNVAAVKEGDRVSAGQVLLCIDPRTYEAEEARIRAQVNYDRNELERIHRLVERGVATDKELDAAQSAYQASKAAHKAALANLERTVITSPIDGVLDTLRPERGEFLAAGAPVATVVDARMVNVVVNVPEKFVHYLPDNEYQHEVVKSAAGRIGRSGKISYISELADPATRTTPVEILMDNRDRIFRSGQIVTVKLKLRTLQEEITIPLDAAIHLERGYAVYVVADGLAVRRPIDVDLDLLQGKRVRILPVEEGNRPLTAGDKLIVRGQRYVSPGEKVVVTHVNGKRLVPLTQPASGPGARANRLAGQED
ncbi:MAG: efflux RND transporter periplasmic adaptor subunit [Phycisphaerae bacterium]